MKPQTIKNTGIKSQELGHTVQETVATGIIEVADAAWLAGTAIFRFGKGLVTKRPEPRAVKPRAAKQSAVKKTVKH